MAKFPNVTSDGQAIKPSRRNFTLGEYPIKVYRSLSGKAIRRSFGNKPYGAVLELSFENVKETVLTAIYDHYHGQGGTTIGFELSDNVIAGLSSGTAAKIKAGNPANDGSTIWFYQETPQVESTYRDLSTITISLISEFAL